LGVALLPRGFGTPLPLRPSGSGSRFGPFLARLGHLGPWLRDHPCPPVVLGSDSSFGAPSLRSGPFGSSSLPCPFGAQSRPAWPVRANVRPVVWGAAFPGGRLFGGPDPAGFALTLASGVNVRVGNSLRGPGVLHVRCWARALAAVAHRFPTRCRHSRPGFCWACLSAQVAVRLKPS
jgi:hypothetical protein